MNERVSFRLETPNRVPNVFLLIRLEEEVQGRLSHIGLVMKMSILAGRPHGDRRMAGMT